MARLYQGLLKLLEWVVIVLTGAVMVVVIAQVFFRYCLGSSLNWSDELAGYLLVWISFLGAVLVMHERRHIAFGLVTMLLGPQIRRGVLLLADLLVLGFCAVMVVTGVGVVRGTVGQQAITFPFPIPVVYAIIPLSGLLMGLALLVQMCSWFVGAEKEEAKPAPGLAHVEHMEKGAGI